MTTRATALADSGTGWLVRAHHPCTAAASGARWKTTSSGSMTA
jgi:hypothetical protein